MPSFESNHSPGRILDAFPATTLERLRAINWQSDPDRLFTQNFDVSMVTS